MKHFSLFTFLFFLLLNTNLKSQDILNFQEYYLGTGYNIGIGSFTQLNSILNEFDDGLVQEKEFKNIRTPHGLTFNLGTHQSFFNFDLNFSNNGTKRISEFSSSDTLFRREVKMNLNSFSYGIGIFFPTESGMGIGANAGVNQNFIKLSSRQAEATNISKSSFITPIKDQLWGMTFSLKFYFGDFYNHGTKFMIQPYYSYTFKSLDLSPLNELINSDTTNNNLNQKFNHFGIRLIITYSIIQ